jgi:uncharacterized membrane protein
MAHRLTAMRRNGVTLSEEKGRGVVSTTIQTRKAPGRHASRNAAILHESFRAGILLKGLHALIEVIGGIGLLCASPQALNRVLMPIAARDFAAAHLRVALERFATSGRHFASWYLLSHGGVNLILVIALFMNELWAYPVMLAVLAGFVGYQAYRFSHTHSITLVALTVFDIVVIVLTWIEYRKQMELRRR